MKVVQVTHDGNLPFLFETAIDLPPGLEVVVETCHGRTLGRTAAVSMDVDDVVAGYILPCFNRGKPLKKVIGFVEVIGEVTK